MKIEEEVGPDEEISVHCLGGGLEAESMTQKVFIIAQVKCNSSRRESCLVMYVSSGMHFGIPERTNVSSRLCRLSSAKGRLAPSSTVITISSESPAEGQPVDFEMAFKVCREKTFRARSEGSFDRQTCVGTSVLTRSSPC